MLAYAFKVIKQSNFQRIQSESFEHVDDLFAGILVVAVSQQLKQGLYREYVTQGENLPFLRGRLDISKTIQNRIQQRQILSCQFDELTENNAFNQILKTTMINLLRKKSVKPSRRHAIKKILAFFDGIDMVDISNVQWGLLQFHRSNRICEMLLHICYFVYTSQLPQMGNTLWRLSLKAALRDYMRSLF